MVCLFVCFSDRRSRRLHAHHLPQWTCIRFSRTWPHSTRWSCAGAGAGLVAGSLSDGAGETRTGAFELAGGYCRAYIVQQRQTGVDPGGTGNRGLPNFQTSLHNPGFAVYAKLGGGQGFHISDLAELEPTLKMAFASCKPCVVDVAVNPDELSMPPKIMWDRMFGYGVTKAKELLGE
jgi:hypothetical protein